MPTNLKEIGFEEFIENYLVNQNNFISRSSFEHYDKDLCLDKELVLRFVKDTQKEKWEELEEKHGDLIEKKFFKRLDSEIESRGVLEVLRNGFKDRGMKFDMAYFKPRSGMNPEAEQLYDKNIFSLVRQLKYSSKNENSIDMVLFLNGLPVFTVELKNQLTGQSVQNAIRQYKSDRDPREKLLKFKRCLTHFAVDTDLVYMATKLNGVKTHFLPFNKGYESSAGNPPNPDGYKTAYMWEDVWSRDSIMELVGDFICNVAEQRVSPQGKKYSREIIGL